MKKVLIIAVVASILALAAEGLFAEEWKTFRVIPRDWRLVSVTLQRYGDGEYPRLWFQDKEGNVFQVALTGGLDWSGEMHVTLKIPSK